MPQQPIDVQEQVAVGVDPALTYTPAALPAAVVGQPYPPTAVGTVSGGTPVFSATGLPPGLMLDPATGVLSGTPTGPAPTITVAKKSSGGTFAFAPLTVPGAPTVEDLVADAGGGLWVCGSDAVLRRYDEVGGWQSYPVPYAHTRGLAPLGGGNCQVGNGASPGYSVTLTGGAARQATYAGGSLLSANLRFFATVQLGDGSLLLFASWGAAYPGSNGTVARAVFRSTDGGATFTFLSQMADVPTASGGVLFCTVLPSGALYSGGEYAGDPLESLDNGATWHPVGLQNANGYTGNCRGVVLCGDGSLLVQKQSTSGVPLQRGLPGGPWAPSAQGIPAYANPQWVARSPATGTLLCASDKGLYVSTDDGHTWAACPTAPTGLSWNKVACTASAWYAAAGAALYASPLA